MNKLLIVLASILLVSCDNKYKIEAYAKQDCIQTLIAGREWDIDKSLYQMVESNENWTKYKIDNYGQHAYYTVKNNKIISVWIKRDY